MQIQQGMNSLQTKMLDCPQTGISIPAQLSEIFLQASNSAPRAKIQMQPSTTVSDMRCLMKLCHLVRRPKYTKHKFEGLLHWTTPSYCALHATICGCCGCFKPHNHREGRIRVIPCFIHCSTFPTWFSGRQETLKERTSSGSKLGKKPSSHIWAFCQWMRLCLPRNEIHISHLALLMSSLIRSRWADKLRFALTVCCGQSKSTHVVWSLELSCSKKPSRLLNTKYRISLEFGGI